MSVIMTFIDLLILPIHTVYSVIRDSTTNEIPHRTINFLLSLENKKVLKSSDLFSQRVEHKCKQSYLESKLSSDDIEGIC
jgi:hypothetical protein